MKSKYLSHKTAAALNESAENLFKHHANAQVLLATADGNLFFEKDKNGAQNHARSIGQQELIIINKGENVEGVDNPVKPLSQVEVRVKERLEAKQAANEKKLSGAEKRAADMKAAAERTEKAREADKKAKEEKQAASDAENQATAEAAEAAKKQKEEEEAAQLAELQEREAEVKRVAEEEAASGAEVETGGVEHNAKSVEALFADGKADEAKAAYETISKTQKGKVSKETKAALGITE